MSALERVRRARRVLVGTVAASSLLWAVLAALGVLIVAAVVDLAAPMPVWIRQAFVAIAPLVALGNAVLIATRARHVRSLERVALLLEERVPALRFALVTAIQLPDKSALERTVADAMPRHPLRRPVARSIGVPAIITALLLSGAAVFPASVRQRVLRPRAGDMLSARVNIPPSANRLAVIAVRVVAPRYASRAPQTIDDPSSVAALVGSTIEILGRGARTNGLPAIAAHAMTNLPVLIRADTWSVELSMPARPTVVRLADRGFDRLLALEPVADQPPDVTLARPARDSTYLLPQGTVELSATAGDDVGLGAAAFEIRHSSGNGELFATTRTVVGAATFNSARSGSIRSVARLDTMHLLPGDVLHIRAIAVDENDVSGPDSGYSETRTLRIDDPKSRDTLRIAPSAVAKFDTTAMSERMLIVRAESLLSLRRRLSDSAYVARSRDLARKQDELRERVEELVSTPEVEQMTVNIEEAKAKGEIAEGNVAVLFHDASMAMVDAEKELSGARVESALPPMRKALDRLDRARQSRRLYLRGVLLVEPVDVDKARLKGTDKATVGARAPRPVATDVRSALRARLDHAVTLLGTDAGVALDSLIVLRVDALQEAPDVAAPLGRAIDAVRGRRDAAADLLAARRRLERRTESVGALSPWQGGGGGIP